MERRKRTKGNERRSLCILKKASETAEFKAYLAKNGLEPMYLFGAEAEAYMLEYQKNYLVSIGK